MLNPFKGKKHKKKSTRAPGASHPPAYADAVQPVPHQNGAADVPIEPRRIVFHCQLAHGSPTGIVSSFTGVEELYQQIAACFDLSPSEILFCTLNSHKIDMTKLMAVHLALDDFIFAHIKGRPKEVDVEKAEDALGLTITDNGAGYAFIKGIKEGSVASKVEGIYVGDHIEKINNSSVVGLRHHEVARKLKEIPVGETFTLRVVEPMKSGFSEIGGKSAAAKKSGGIGTGKETLRLRSKGPATVEAVDEVVNVAVEKINSLLEAFLGISDAELAESIWEIGNGARNPSDFATAVQGSDLNEFGFTESFIFDVWGAISDAKQGRLQKMQNFHEQF